MIYEAEQCEVLNIFKHCKKHSGFYAFIARCLIYIFFVLVFWILISVMNLLSNGSLLGLYIVQCSSAVSKLIFFNIVCNVYVQRFQNRFRSSFQIMGSYHGPNCPRCNDNAHGCQNLFCSKMRFTGATFGAMNGFGRAIQFQKMNTQHFSNAFIHEWCSVIFEVMNFRGVRKKIDFCFLDRWMVVSVLFLLYYVVKNKTIFFCAFVLRSWHARPIDRDETFLKWVTVVGFSDFEVGIWTKVFLEDVVRSSSAGPHNIKG